MKLEIRSVVVLALCTLATLGASGCNTFRGAGKDIQKGGEAVENAAENAQSKNDSNRNQAPRHTIMSSAAKGGDISPLGGTTTAPGADRTFVVKADSGYHVADVLVDGKSIGAVNRHTFNNVTESHTIAALFTSNPR